MSKITVELELGLKEQQALDDLMRRRSIRRYKYEDAIYFLIHELTSNDDKDDKYESRAISTTIERER